MTRPPTRRWTPPAVVVGLIALAIWILLAVCMGGNSLDRADKAASVIAMLVALGTFTVAVVERQPRSSDPEVADAAQERTSVFKRPSVIAGLSTMGVGLVVVLCVGLVTNDRGAGTQGEPSGGAGDRSTAAASPSAVTAPTSASPSASGRAEPCASPPAAASPSLETEATSEVIRHDGALILSEGYYADLDSLCPDWDVTDLAGAKQDIGNNGRGITRSINAGTQIALVEKDAAGTFTMCSSNTDYVSGTIGYEQLKLGARYCVLTDAGRRSLITVKRVRREAGRTTVHLDVRTWAEKRPGEETNYVPWIVLGIIVLVLLGGGAKSATDASRKGD